MKPFKSYSIKRKLKLIILAVSSMTLLIASVIFLYYDRENLKISMQNELSILANIIGDRSSAALLFDDKRVVRETLASLKVKTTIISAMIYKLQGDIFVQYHRQPIINKIPSEQQAENTTRYDIVQANAIKQEYQQFKFSTQFLEVWEPIIQSGETIGVVYLKSDLTELNQRLQYFLKTISIVYLLSIFIAFLMASRLQKIISDPISGLVKITSLISQKKDYSIRAYSQTDDELGKLITRFNEMLEQIQSRDIALQEVNSHLEQRVEERTQALSDSNKQLVKAKDLADEASRAKSEFLANMSHEIRTPMNGVLTTAELMLSEEMSHKSRSYLNIINSSAFSLLGIINDILDFSKIEAGKLVIENSPFHIDRLFDRLSDIFLNKFAEKKLELLFDIDSKTPDNLFGDSMRLQQILINLIANSLKFTPENGTVICGTKVIKSDSERVQLTFFVKDSGIGIAASKIETLFNAFTQADSSTTRQYGGTGLGLTICKSLIELMGGTIRVESKPDQGSYFSFELMLDMNVKISSNQDKLLFSLPAGIENMNVLVVDDQPESLIISSNILQSFGFNATLSSSGKEACEIIKNKHDKSIDLVLVDWMMPELDGLETSRLMRQELDFQKPIILMSAFSRDEHLETAHRDSINAFLQKPLRQSVLFDTVMRLYNDDYQPDDRQKMTVKQTIYAEHLHGNHLLIAEDNVINQQVIMAVFDKVDVSIKLVNNGKEAFEAIQQYDFDAVLMDMQMPVMDGYEATRKIRAIPEFNEIPIIALTAHAMDGDEDKCLQAGSSAYVTKPINQERLFQVLARFLQAKSTPTEKKFEIKNFPGKFSDEESPLLDTIPGLNIYEAIKLLNIDKVIFKKILLQFYSHNDARISLMSGFMKNNQWQQLKDMAHDLKGSGANIGAYNLQKKSYQLELSCTEPVDIRQLENSFNKFSVALQQVLESISTFVVPDIVPETSVIVDNNKIKAGINELKKALKNGKPVEIREYLMRLKQDSKHPQLMDLELQINNFDFDEALETLLLIAADTANKGVLF
ncbi:MAG: response regulator [gamma proteobacterium symbiont of Taylorina sp.]|nr:response regulator [gamma proteobacterium symbiont of Taylorina sp.]